MRENKGFTLVEMLGVLIILIVVFMIMFPSLTKIIKDTNDKIDNATITVIEDATTDFLLEKNDIYPKNDDYTYCITIEQLIDNGNLTNKEISSLDDTDKFVKTTFENGKSVYVLTDTCTVSKPNIEFALIGNNNMSFEVGVGGQYVEPGANAKNKAGEVVSYVTEIINKNKVTVAYVDTTKIGIYTIKYSATIDGKDYAIERIVKVIDTTAPTITVNPTEEKISTSNSTYNVMDGVIASDNSGDVPKVTASSNLSLKQIGVYTIIYTAEDSSGNKETSRRTVIVKDPANGDIVYYNPESNAKCPSASAVSTSGTKTGCMKWYALNFSDTGNTTVNLLLDHNTTLSVAFNSDNISTTMKEVAASLISDTSTWNATLNARLITAAEIAQIVGYDEFASTQNEVYIDTLTSTAPESLSDYHYGWLYDRLNIACKETSNCPNNIENTPETSTLWGYWTSTARWGSVWAMDRDSRIHSVLPTTNSGIGVRPVITVSKTKVY